MLTHWCAVANLDPVRMVARAARLTTGQGDGLDPEPQTRAKH